MCSFSIHDYDCDEITVYHPCKFYNMDSIFVSSFIHSLITAAKVPTQMKIQSTLLKLASHKSNNHPSQRSFSSPLLFIPVHSINFNPSLVEFSLIEAISSVQIDSTWARLTVVQFLQHILQTFIDILILHMEYVCRSSMAPLLTTTQHFSHLFRHEVFNDNLLECKYGLLFGELLISLPRGISALCYDPRNLTGAPIATTALKKSSSYLYIHVLYNEENCIWKFSRLMAIALG